jgi:hypothetical protein
LAQAPLSVQIAEPVDECDPDTWIDRSHQKLCDGVIGSAQWFDSFFGDRRYEEEARGTRIRLRTSVVIEEEGEVTPRIGTNVKLALPNLDERVDIIIDGLASSEDDLPAEEHLETVFQDIEDEIDLTAATRVVVAADEKKWLDFDVGIRLSTDEVEPFIKIRSRTLYAGKKLGLRWTHFGFWESDDGFGTRGRIDVDYRLHRNCLGRFASEITWAEFTEEVEFVERISINHHNDKRTRAIGAAAQLEFQTQTDTITRGLTSLKWRTRFIRDWLFFEIEPAAIFPEERDYSFTPQLTFRFEMIYGDYRWRRFGNRGSTKR